MKFFKLLLIALAFPSFLFAQTDFEKQINSYAGMLAEKITQAGKAKIAVSDFLDNNGNITELGKVIAEELGINISNTGKGFQVMERENLNAILKEHQLASTGLIDPETAKQLGKLKAVDAVIVGTVFPFGDNLKVNIKILDTETGMSIGGTTGSIARTDAINKLFENKLGSVSKNYMGNANENTESASKNSNKPDVCKHCNGLGTIASQGTCDNCDGTGKMSCATCNGRGGFACTTCNGTGEAPFGPGSNWEKRPCKTCKGTGKSNCKTCAGKGVVECTICNGKKIASTNEVCKYCNGKGQVVGNQASLDAFPCTSGNGSLKIINKSTGSLTVIISDEKIDLVNNRLSQYELTDISANSDQVSPEIKPGVYYVCTIDKGNGWGATVLQSKKIVIEACKEAKISF